MRASLWSGAVFLAAILSACSSGGGGSSGLGLSVSASTLEFGALQGGPVPGAKAVEVQVSNPDAAYFGAAFVPADPPWGRLDVSGSDRRWSVSVSVTNTALAPGVYGATFRVGIARKDQSVIGYEDVTVRYTVTARLAAAPAGLQFQAVAGAAAPAAQSVSVSGSGLAWTASADAAWLRLGATSGTAPTTLPVGVDTTGLAPGPYDGIVTISSGAQTTRVSVHLAVDPVAVTASAASLAFSGVNGASIEAQTLAIAMNDGSSVPFAASADAAWVVLGAASGTTPADLVVSVDPSKGSLASGPHQATVRLTATRGGELLTRDVTVDLSLTKPTLSTTSPTIALGGADGRDVTPAQLTLQLGTGTAAYAWSASADTAWVRLAPASGRVSSAGTALQLDADRTALAPGTHAATVSFTATVNGDVVTADVPVTLRLDDHRLLASDDGVGLAKIPGMARLSRTLLVRDTFGQASTWTASSDAPWLTVSASGETPGELVVDADPTSLASDALYEATVTITPDQPGIAPEHVKVGLWVGSATVAATRTMAGTFTAIATDPIRPWVYVHSGGTAITAYHVYTGAVVKTFDRVAPTLGALTISTDGATIFAEDKTNHRVVPVNVASGTVGTGWAGLNTTVANLAFARVNGKRLVFAGYAQVFDVDTGAIVDATPLYPWTGLRSAVSRAGNRICGVELNASPHDAYCRPFDYSWVAHAPIVGDQKSAYAEGYDGDIEVSDDGARVYFPGGSQTVYDAATMTGLQTLKGGRSAEVTRDGRVVLAMGNWYDAYDLWVYDADGFTLGSYRLAGYAKEIVDPLVKVSADGLCVVAVTDAPNLVFQLIGP